MSTETLVNTAARTRTAPGTGETTTITVRVKSDLYAQIKHAAQEADRDVPQFVSRALKNLKLEDIIAAGK